MAKVTFVGLTPKQAKTLAEWFVGQGEQDAQVWFDIHEVPTPLANVRRKGGYRKVKKNGDVTVFCHTP